MTKKLEIHAMQNAALEGARMVLGKMEWKSPISGHIDIYQDLPLKFSVSFEGPWGTALVVVLLTKAAGIWIPARARYVGANREGDKYFTFEMDPILGVTVTSVKLAGPPWIP